MITYFIQSGKQIKIGKTGNLRQRMSALQTSTANRLKLLAVSDMPESEAHAKACTMSYRVSGEWFRATPELCEWIKELPDHMEMHAPIKTVRTGWNHKVETKVSSRVCEALVTEAREKAISTQSLMRQILFRHANQYLAKIPSKKEVAS